MNDTGVSYERGNLTTPPTGKQMQCRFLVGGRGPCGKTATTVKSARGQVSSKVESAVAYMPFCVAAEPFATIGDDWAGIFSRKQVLGEAVIAMFVCFLRQERPM